MKALIILLIALLPFTGIGQTVEEYFKHGLEKDSLKDYRGAIASYNKVIEFE
jgi:hypothetical protein